MTVIRLLSFIFVCHVMVLCVLLFFVMVLHPCEVI